MLGLFRIVCIASLFVSRKRVRAVPYDSCSRMVDKALGTRRAPVGWQPVLHRQRKSEKHNVPHGSVTPSSASASSSWRIPPMTTSTMKNQMPSPSPPGVITPYLSLSDRFKQKLQHAFGEHATVRGDRGARPRTVSTIQT